MDERLDKRKTVAQEIAELNAFREVAESTRDRLRILIVSAKQSERQRLKPLVSTLRFRKEFGEQTPHTGENSYNSYFRLADPFNASMF